MNLFIAGTDFVCVLFLTVILIAMHFSERTKEKKYGYFVFCLVLLLVFTAADGLSYIMDEYGGNDALHFLFNLCSYMGADIVFPAFVYFVSEIIRETGKFSNVHARVILVACAFDMWLVIYGAFTGALFRIENQKIVYDYLNNYLGIIQFFGCAYFLIQIFLKKNQLEKKLVVTVSLYFVLPIITMVAEIINPSLAFAYMSVTVAFLIVYVVIVREDLQASALGEKIMYKASVTDNLTGLLNRRAYSEDTAQMPDQYPEDFIYMSLDVNGLKNVNDNIGHAAGDEIIRGAAQCMRRSFDGYGRIYRTGGDEFTAILNIPADRFEGVIDAFEEETARWRGNIVGSLSVSFGYVKAEEIQGVSIHDVSVLADKRMYASKTAFYKRKGVDRRGQFEAHTALCNLYTKILRINISDDTFQIINMDETEQAEEMGFTDTISGWLAEFGRRGNVHPDDLEEYLAMTDLDYMRGYFRQGKNSLCITYRRRYGDIYKKVMMEIIPSGDYSDNNQSLFLYVKDIDR